MFRSGQIEPSRVSCRFLSGERMRFMPKKFPVEVPFVVKGDSAGKLSGWWRIQEIEPGEAPR
jgi:hypothetical protein